MTDGQLLDAGLAFHDAGYAVLPTRADGSKAPGVPTWRMYQKDRPTRSQVERWLTSGAYHGFGIITGAVSGHLEMLELEGRAVQAGLGNQLADLVHDAGLGDLWKRITDGYQETTPSGGVHLLYRVIDGEAKGNTKLARDADGQVLIETRGEGGYVVVAPSNGPTHPSGRPWALKTGGPTTIAAITGDERDALHAVCAALDRTPEPAPEPHHEPRARRGTDRLTPGDDYNQRARWTDILEPHGWARVSQRGHTTYWRRPGKQVGISATTGRNDGDNLYVFSTSTEFDQEKPYSKFAAHALLEHGGDFRAAARALAQQGYGDQRTATTPRDHTPAGAAAPNGTAGAAAALPAPHDDELPPPPEAPDDDPGDKPPHLELVPPSELGIAYVNWRDLFTKPRTPTVWYARPLIAEGRVTLLYSPGKTGKSLIAMEAAAAIATGMPVLASDAPQPRNVLYIDQEMTAEDWLDRLTDMGYTDRDVDLLERRLHLAQLQAWPPMDTPAGGAMVLAEALRHDAKTVIIDTASKVIRGEENSNDTHAAFYRCTVVPLKRAGIAVLVLDHTGKDLERGARGGSAKTDNVDLAFELLTRGTDLLSLRCSHARFRDDALTEPTFLRRETGPLRHAVDGHARPPAPGGGVRPTHLMEKVSRYVEINPNLTRNGIETAVRGKREYVRLAIDLLVAEGYLHAEKGPNRALVHRSIKPFREEETPGQNDPGEDEE